MRGNCPPRPLGFKRKNSFLRQLSQFLFYVVVVSHSVVSACAALWTLTHQAPLSMGFSRQEYCSALPSPSPGDLPDPGVEPKSPVGQADSFPLSHMNTPLLFLLFHN